MATNPSFIENGCGVNTVKGIITDSKINRMPSFWIPALKEYNSTSGTWCVPKKGTPAYEEVKAIMTRMKEEAAAPKSRRKLRTAAMREQNAMAMEDRDAPAPPPKKTREEKVKEYVKEAQAKKMTQKDREQAEAKKAKEYIKETKAKMMPKEREQAEAKKMPKERERAESKKSKEKNYATLIKGVYDDNDNYHFGILFRIGDDYYVKEIYRTIHTKHAEHTETTMRYYYPTFELSPNYRVYAVTYDEAKDKIVRKEKGKVKYYPVHGFLAEKIEHYNAAEERSREWYRKINKTEWTGNYDKERQHFTRVVEVLRKQNERNPNPINQMFVDSLDYENPTEIGLSKEAADELGLDPSLMEEHDKAQASKPVKNVEDEKKRKEDEKEAKKKAKEERDARKKEMRAAVKNDPEIKRIKALRKNPDNSVSEINRLHTAQRKRETEIAEEYGFEYYD